MMVKSTTGPDAMLKYELEVGDQGRVELNVPLATGARIVVFVAPEPEDDFRTTGKTCTTRKDLLTF
jgi:hypothetical protein